MKANVIRSEFDGDPLGDNEVIGTEDNDRIIGTEFADRLDGGDGNDRILTKGGGADIVTTGAGNDRIVLEGDNGAFVIASDFESRSDVFDLRKAGITRDQVEIVETVSIEVDPENSGLGGLGGLEIQIEGGETIALPQFSSVDELDLDRDFRFADDDEEVVATDEADAEEGAADVEEEVEEEVVDVEEEVVAAPGNLNVVTNSFGTDGDDLIDLNDPGNDPGPRILLAGQGEDTIITSTQPSEDLTQISLGSFGLDQTGNDPSDDDGAGFPDDEDADTVVVNSTGGDVQLFDFNAGDNGDDRIDLSNTGITSLDQLTFRDDVSTGSTSIEADNLQGLVLRGDSDGQNISNQADDLNEDDFIFADA